ncbi:MAG: heavy-metal-associated domain-containing protein [Alphaproteobacteria bacterium]|nr:heavy-metal-associated domain-containing protein [Alphaproteobacteria bacterium]
MQHQFEVKGMTCGHCEMSVKKALLRLDPKATVKIVRTENKVTVQSEQPRGSLMEAIAEEGYAVQ